MGASYVVFASTYVCVIAASSRAHWVSQLHLCPPFVGIKMGELREQFNSKVKRGDDPEIIEKTLKELGVGYSWDRFLDRYQGIIRHPNSDFHAITVFVYLDESGKYKDIEINDSFTAL